MEFEIESVESCSKCREGSFKVNNIPVLDQDTSYNEFFKNYMQPNNPCLIKNVTENWVAHSKWLTTGQKPDLNYLKDKYGSCKVTVYNCNERYFNSQQTETCTVETFLDEFWQTDSSKLKYLKDWHLKNTFRDDDFYQVPIYFASDWLNEFLTENSDDDYRFVYMGRAGTWTPFHADVFNSFSWSANVCGQKKWILFPPGEEDSFRDALDNLPYDISQIYHEKEHFEVIQNPGEAIFVPSGWYHQVWNLENTISINHNWINGCNIEKIWFAIEENLNQVKKEIGDCEEMEGFLNHCQIVLNASFGMDFYKFFDFLEFIGQRRLSFLRNQSSGVLFHSHKIGPNHALFDLKAVKLVLEKFLGHGDIQELFTSSEKCPEKFLDEVSDFINSTNYTNLLKGNI